MTATAIQSHQRLKTGELLLAKGLISQQDLTVALLAQVRSSEIGKHLRIGDIIVRMGLATLDQVDSAIRATGGVTEGSADVHLPPSVVHRFKIMPLDFRDGVLHVASQDVLTEWDIEQIKIAACQSDMDAQEIKIEPRDRRAVADWLQRLTYVDDELLQRLARQLCQDTHDAPTMQKFIDAVFQGAIQQCASDIHLERSTEGIFCWVSLRLNSVMIRKVALSPEGMNAICTRIKSLASMDISEDRRPQDGRTLAEFSGRQVDLRISAVPREDGETISIRILDHSKVSTIESVFHRHPFVLERVKRLVAVRGKTSGIVLVTGPTGQGKSTTLAAMVHGMPRTLLKVMTIEDPVENRVPFVHQSPINPILGNTYAVMMRAFMRQDPDVLMVGEIRDSETAEEFIKGAETGHMMLSTEHTNDVSSAITRLFGLLPEEMRMMAGFTLSSSLRAVMNQRLVPALCLCAVPHPEARADYKLLFDVLGEVNTDTQFRKKVGCEKCNFSGYASRELVVEAAFFPVTKTLQIQMEEVLFSGKSPSALLSCEGVHYYSKIEAVKTLLEAGLIDVETALSTLNLENMKEAIS